MQRQNIIVLEKCPDIVEAFGSLKKACEVHGFKYNTLSRKKFPFNHDGWIFHKVKFNESQTV